MSAFKIVVISTVIGGGGCRTTNNDADSGLLFLWSRPTITMQPSNSEYLIRDCRTQAAAISHALRHAASLFEIDISTLRTAHPDDYSSSITVFVPGRHDGREQAYRIDQSEIVGYHGAWRFLDFEERSHEGEISSSWTKVHSDINCKEWSNITRFASGLLTFQYEENDVYGYIADVPIIRGRKDGRQNFVDRDGGYGYREYSEGQIHGIEKSFFSDGRLRSRFRFEHGMLLERYLLYFDDSGETVIESGIGLVGTEEVFHSTLGDREDE